MRSLQTPRGTYDSFDLHLRKIEALSSLLFEIARSWGFDRVDVPTFEHSEVFKQTSEFAADKCYVFSDKSGRELVLRPDVNGPLARVVATNFTSSPMPVKLFFADKVFRYRHSKKREFRMFGLETFGISELVADLEVISVVAEMTKRLGFSPGQVKYSHLQIPGKIIAQSIQAQTLSVSAGQVIYDLRSATDVTVAGDLLRTLGFPPGITDLLLEIIFATPDNRLSYELLARASRSDGSLALIEESLSDFATGLADSGLACQFEIGNLHGSGFYSGLTYRFIPTGFEAELADGGRYDNMVHDLGGPQIPATGIGFGMERLIRYTESLGLSVPLGQRQGILYTTQGLENTVVEPIVSELRRKGLIAAKDLLSRKWQKAVRYAEHHGYSVCVAFEKVTDDQKISLRVTSVHDKSTQSFLLMPEKVADMVLEVIGQPGRAK